MYLLKTQKLPKNLFFIFVMIFYLNIIIFIEINIDIDTKINYIWVSHNGRPLLETAKSVSYNGRFLYRYLL